MPLSNRMARAIIDRYPAVWRQRYADEMRALIDAQTLRWRDVADLARRALIERARALFEPGDHPHLAMLLAGGANGGFSLVSGIVIAMVALSIGRALAGTFGPVQDWFMVTAFLIVSIGWVRHIRTMMWKVSQTVGTHVPRPAEPLRRTIAWSLALFVSVVVLQWGADTSMGWWSSAFWHGLLFAYQFDRLWPSNGLPVALNQRAVAREQMKFARMELTRCETLAAEGRVSDELSRAQAEMRRWQTQYDDAMRTLHGMGYRAQFR